MAKISFQAKPFNIGTRTIIQLPLEASAQLSSRGMTMVDATINGFDFQTSLEPDGKKSHWFEVDEKIMKAAKITIGEMVMIEIAPSEHWPEPHIPDDLQHALEKEPHVNTLWKDITTAARWDWIRWIRATNNPDTRKKRIEVTFSKLKGGSRRPCCFNRSMCTDFTVSKNGILIGF